MDKTAAEAFAKWIETFEPRAFPDAALPWGRPSYACETVEERVEPFATAYDRLQWEHPDYGSECGSPAAEWYTPTPKLRALERRLDTLRAKAFRTVPNPDYDPERAAAWDAERKDRFNQIMIEVGQSFLPDAAP